MKSLTKLFLILLTLSFYPVQTQAQDEMFRQKKERKKLWRKWRKNREAYNPYLRAKAKNKPSARMAKGNRKDLKRQKRAARKELRNNRKKFGTSD